MGGEWRELTIADLGKVVTGKTPSTRAEYNFGGDIPFVSPRDMNGSRYIWKTERYLSQQGASTVKNSVIPENSVMVSCIGSDMGKAAIALKKCVTNQQINSIVVNQKFDFRLVYYNLSARKDEIRGLASGSAQPILNKTDFSRLRISIPELNTQKAIAHILGSLDDKIELNRRMNATLEVMARALFKSWFVDFDPVIDNALAAGNPIPEPMQARAKARKALGDQRKPLPAAIQKQFPSRFVFTEEMGWVPEGWEVKKIGEILDLAYGKSLPATKRHAGDIPVYGSGGMSGFHNEKLVDGPGVVIGRKGTVGSMYWVNGDFFPIDTVFYVVKKINVPLYWLYQSLQLIDIKSMGADSAVPGVNRNAVYARSLAIPAKVIFDVYLTQVDAYNSRNKALSGQNDSLSGLRDTLLPKLISGQLRIPDAEKLVADAA